MNNGDSRDVQGVQSVQSLEGKYWEMAKKVLSETDYLLYDLQYIPSNKTLCVFIMDKTTKSALIEDCAIVDNAFTPYVEAAEWIPDDFVLEVSSPGVYRRLKTEEHFQSAEGERVKIELISSELARELKLNKKFNAFLKRVDSQNQILILDRDEVKIELRMSDVKSAHLDPVL